MNWLVIPEARERYNEMLREAEERRRVRRIQAARPTSPRLSARTVRRYHHRMLAHLGRALVAWGVSLQTRYDTHFGTLATGLADPEG